MIGIIYCRVSSLEQVQGTSLEHQKVACLEYAQRKDIQVPETFIEKGESATAADRTELLKALDYCRRHKGTVQAFIVWKLDRFARNTIDHFALQAELQKYGTTLHSVTEPIGDDPMGKMMETLLAGYAQFENDIRKQRCEAGMRRRLTEGIWPWSPPLGYIHSKKRTERRKTHPDEPDPERFSLVQRALRAYATGRYSIEDLTRLMNTWGLRTRTGKSMFKQLTERILKDKFYAGVLVDPWTGEEHRGNHVAMITIEEHNRIQYRKRRHSRLNGIPRLRLNPDFPLRRLVVCSCGRLLTAAWHTGRTRKYAYYLCHNPECPHFNRAIAKSHLEDLFTVLLRGLTPKEDFLRILAEVLVDHWTVTRRHLQADVDRGAREKRRLEERRRELLRMRLNAELTRDEFLEAKAEIEGQFAALAVGRSQTLLASDLNLDEAIPRVNHFLQNLADEWLAADDIAQKQRIQRLIFPQGLIYDASTGAYRTAILSDLFSLCAEFPGDKSWLVAEVGLRLNQLLNNIKELALLLKAQK